LAWFSLTIILHFVLNLIIFVINSFINCKLHIIQFIFYYHFLFVYKFLGYFEFYFSQTTAYLR